MLILATETSSNNRDSELLARIEQLESQVVQVKGSLMKLRRQQVIARRKVGELIKNVYTGFLFIDIDLLYLQPWELLTAGDVASAQSGSVHEQVRVSLSTELSSMKNKDRSE